MKNISKKIKYIGLGILIALAGTVYGFDITVPAATTNGQTLVSTTTGAYIATTTDPFHVGAIYATSSTETSTFSGPLNLTSVATTTTGNFNTQLWVPSNFATAGCAGDATKTDFGACVNALNAKLVATGQIAGQIMVPDIKVTQAQWITPINFSGPTIISFDCVAGAQMSYGGTATSTLFKSIDPTGHVVSNDYGCQYMGSNTLIAAGQSNSNTTIGIGFGSTSANDGKGAVGINFHDNTVNGFGINVQSAANAYMLSFHNNAISGGNGNLLGNSFYEDKSANSGERLVVDGNSFTDPGNLIATSSVYMSDGGQASSFWTNNSFDDVGIYVGSSNGTVVINGNHFENSDSTGYHGYIPIVNPSSDRSTQISVSYNEFANDGNSSNTFYTIIKHGGQLTEIGNHIDNYGGSTIGTFSDHSNDNGVESELICQLQVQGGGLTNIIGGSGAQAYSLAAGSTCFTDNANSYPVGIIQNSNNTADIRNGSANVATFDNQANWTFGLGSASTLTINNKLAVTTSATVASSTPFGKVSINPVSGDTVALAIGSTTQNLFQVNTNGQVAIGNILFNGASAIAGLGTSNYQQVISQNVNNIAGQLYLANTNFGANAVTSLTLGNGNSTNAGASSAYIGGIVYCGPNFATVGFGGCAPNGLAIYNTDGRVDIGATSANAASSTVNIYAGNSGSFAGGVPDWTLTGGTANMGLGTTSPGARFGLQGMAGGSIPLLLVSSSTSGYATSTVLIIDKNGKLGIGTTSPAVALDVKGAIVSEENAIAFSATPTFDFSTSNQIEMTMTNNVTGITFSGGQRGGAYRVVLCQDGTGNRTVAGWPASILWTGNSAPTITATASKCDVMTFTASFGTTTSLEYLGGYVQNF